jgi:oligoribonuclease NrnB/cAMP/cGMP phosphodiesterase (DHH superfamily)
MVCYQVYTHKDLDGAVSLLTLLWALPNDHIRWKAYNNLEIDSIKSDLDEVNSPCPTFILDLSLRKEFVENLDLEHITFIDHHESSEPLLNQFKKAKIIYENTTSNALLMAKKYSTSNGYPARTTAQKTLVALADDFDCYRLQIPESYDLNILFWSEYKNNFTKFIKDYHDGFKGFTPEQKKAIAFIKNSAYEQSKKINLFSGNVQFGSKSKRVLAAMGDTFSNLCADYLIKDHKPDIFIFINLKSEKVYIRQHTKEDPINVGTFAEKICEGGGHKHAGGGVITPLFLEITKNLAPISV